jgi:hypothetical protein
MKQRKFYFDVNYYIDNKIKAKILLSPTLTI